jgi:cytochrome c oxidase subunit 2
VRCERARIRRVCERRYVSADDEGRRERHEHRPPHVASLRLPLSGIKEAMSGDRPGSGVRGAALAAVLAAPILLVGCGGKQDLLHPHSHAERRISTLWWVLMTGAWIGFGVIAVLLLLGWWRRNRVGLPFGGGEKAATGLVIGLGVAVPVVFLSALFVWANIFVIRSTDAPAAASASLTVDVIGHQWWWEVRYPGTTAVTADEIHIPARTPVRVVGTTADVIHSLWVPELNRKIDLIPGRSNSILWNADRTGTYEGRCSEFCGLQHAHMSLLVIAQPQAQFHAWLANMSKPATASGSRGEQIFVSHACSGCHQIRGTPARGLVGPDLTHLMSRTTLAAGTIPNTRDDLANWIIDPQRYKPGNKMPALNIDGPQLDALLTYLRGLK